jgi:hypothetical protein
MEAVKMMYRIALPLMALVTASACGGRGATGPLSADDLSSARNAESSLNSTSPRSGPLNIEKECSTYTGHAGEICTITKSNLKEISVGTTIRYAQGATADGMLSSDVVLDPPGPGNNRAFGHCALSLVTGIGVCTISGGTGKFTHLSARVDVTPLGLPNFAWNGTYAFNGEGE